MERDAVLAKVGHVAVAWNEAERIINRILWLYIDTDVRTAEILTEPMRPTDREKLLKQLIREKEIDKKVSDEIVAALSICKTCRENRNIVLHSIENNGTHLSKGVHEIISKLCEDFDKTLIYLRLLQTAVTEITILRLDRETPIGDESSNDELLPEIVFHAPDRPKKPHKLSLKELLRNV